MGDFNTSSRESKCLQEGGCASQKDTCLIYKVKQPFLKAGIITVSDRSIADSLKKLNEDYRLMLKIKGRVTESATARKEEYEAQIEKTYNITDSKKKQGSQR